MRSDPPSGLQATAEAHGYRLSFDPSFLRCADLRTSDGGHRLYEQTAPYRLPPGQAGPSARHELVLEHPLTGRRLRIVVEDPDHVLDRLHVVLKPADRCPKLEASRHPGGEEIVLQNDSLTCPPNC